MIQVQPFCTAAAPEQHLLLSVATSVTVVYMLAGDLHMICVGLSPMSFAPPGTAMVGCLTIMMDVKDSSVVRAAKGGVPGNVTAYDSNQIARK